MSTHVGAISLDVDLIGDALRAKIAEEINQEVRPALDGCAKDLEAVRGEMAKINSMSFAKQAKESGVLRKEYDRTAGAIKNLGLQTRMLDKTEESLRKARRSRNQLQRDANRQLERDGAVAKKTADKLIDAINRVKLIEADRLARKKAVAEAKRQIDERTLKDEERYNKAVTKVWADRLKALSDDEKAQVKIRDKLERDAEARIESEFRRQSAEIKAREAHNARLARLDEQKTKAEEREADRRQRAATRAEERRRKEEDRDKKRKLRQQARDTLYNDVSDYGRKLGYIQTAAGGPLGLAVAAAGIGDLIAVASALSGVLGTLPGILAAAGSAMGTFSVATYGVEDAMSALLDGDLDAFAESLAKLSPNAQQAMLSLQSLWPEFTAAQQAVQDTFFDGFNKELYELADVYLPMARDGMTALAGVFNQFVGISIDTLIDPDVAAQIQDVVYNIVAGFQALQPAVEPLIRTFVTLTDVGSSFLPQLSGIIVDLTSRFSDFIAEAAQTGELQEWIQRGIDSVVELIPLVEDLVGTFIELGPMGAQMLPDIIKAFQTLIDMMPGAIAALDGTFIGPAIQALAELHDMFGNVSKAFTAIGNVGIWVYNTVSQTLSDLVGKLGGLYTPLRAIGKLIGIDLPADISFHLPALSYMPLTPPPAAPTLPGAKTSLPGWNQRFDPGPRGSARGNYQFPGRIPVPPVPAKGSDGKPLSDSDKKKANEASIDPKDFIVNPWGDIGGPQNQPGWPGRPNLNVDVQSLPKTPGIPGMASIPGMPQASLPRGAGSFPWDAVAKGESNGDWSNNNTGRHMTSSGAPRGGLQITDGTWAAFGGTEFAPTANLATKEQQIAVAERIAWDGYKGTKPQGLGAWEAITKGMVPGVNVNTPRGGPGALYPAEAGYVAPAAATPAVPVSPVADAMGAHPQIAMIQELANQMGLTLTAGVRNHDDDGGYHPAGMAGDFSNVSGWTATYADNSPQMEAFAHAMYDNFGPYLSELIYDSPTMNKLVKDGQSVDPSYYGGKDHTNHVHVAINDQNAQALYQAIQGGAVASVGQPVPLSYSDNMYAQNGAVQVDPATGQLGYFQTDSQAIQAAMDSVDAAASDLSKSSYEFAVATKNFQDGLISQQDLIDAQTRRDEDQKKLDREKQDFAEAQRGKWREAPNSHIPGMPGAGRTKQWSLDDEPWGSPKRILGGILQGMGASGDSIEALVGNGIMGTAGNAVGGLGGVLGNVAQDVITAATSVEIPGPKGYAGVPTAPSTDLSKLVHEQSPMAWAQAAGVDVPDYTRQGAGDSAQNLTVNGGPPGDALGRIYSDTAALIDRTFTNLDAAEKARHDQVMSVLNAVKERVGADMLGPAVGEGTTDAMQASGAALGTEIGQAAGPIIAQAVASAIAGSGGGGASNAGAGVVTTTTNAITAAATGLLGFAGGGPVTGGIAGKDSVPAMLMPKEWVLNTDDVGLMGGPAGVGAFLSVLRRKGGIQHFATGGGVDVSKTVGADFFGVSQIPILGTIINLLVAVLLKVIGVQIEARDTLNEISGEFRDFRGDFKAFDANGRLMNDTSALLDRTGSSEQAAADERIRILKVVLQALIKYIVDNVIVPAAKAVGNALLQAASGALQGGLGAAFPGGEIVGSAAGGVITGMGSAAIDIWSEILSSLGLAASEVLMDGIGEVLQSYLPGMTNDLFGGAGLARLFDPLSAAISGATGTITALLGALFGGLGTVIPGKTFDFGGVAHGKGLMPKAIIEPERTLSPRQTMLFDDMVAALERGAQVTSTSRTEVHAPFTVIGNEQGARTVHNRLLSLMS